LVVEDAAVGVQAATAGEMAALGVGRAARTTEG
jgi:beta-phosphoglucomutase-like phosphatase (HAD superfamily)